jgi:hypothetical protein
MDDNAQNAVDERGIVVGKSMKLWESDLIRYWEFRVEDPGARVHLCLILEDNIKRVNDSGDTVGGALIRSQECR